MKCSLMPPPLVEQAGDISVSAAIGTDRLGLQHQRRLGAGGPLARVPARIAILIVVMEGLDPLYTVLQRASTPERRLPPRTSEPSRRIRKSVEILP